MRTLRLKRSGWELAAYQCLRNAAFEQRVNKCDDAAQWWRDRAAMWFRRAAKELANV